MWTLIIAGYLVVGFAAAGFTLAVFPPQKGYRPPIQWLALAVVSYILLWPFLAIIGLGFAVGQWYRQPESQGKTIVRAGGRDRFLYRALYEETPN